VTNIDMVADAKLFAELFAEVTIDCRTYGTS